MPPAETPRRPDTRPSLLSPSSRSAFSSSAATDAADDEQPSVELMEWWLATVEGDDQKIAVAGTFRLNQRLYELEPTHIAKCHAPEILESEDGTILVLTGGLNNLRMLGNGYSDTVCQDFMLGFPRWWQSCNLHYPKPMNTSNSGSGVEHLDSYRTSSIGKHPDGLRSSSRNDSVFPKSSHLANGTPRFEQHTCDGDIATNENVAASSEAGKGSQRTPVVTLDVQGCREDTQHMALDEEMATSVYLDVQNTPSVTNGTPILEKHTCDGDIPTNEGFPSKERGHDDIANDVSLAPTMQCTNNAVTEAVDSTPAIDHNKTPLACLKNQGVMVGKVYKRRAKTSGENRHRASNNKPVGRPKKQKISHEKHRSTTRSHETRSPVSQVLWSPLTRGKATSLSMSTPEDLKLKRTRSGRVVVPQLNEGCQFIVYGRDRSITGVIGLDSPAMPKGSEFKSYQRKKRRTK